MATRNSPGNSPSRRAALRSVAEEDVLGSNPRRRVLLRRTSSGNEETWRICERTRRWRLRELDYDSVGSLSAGPREIEATQSRRTSPRACASRASRRRRSSSMRPMRPVGAGRTARGGEVSVRFRCRFRAVSVRFPWRFPGANRRVRCGFGAGRRGFGHGLGEEGNRKQAKPARASGRTSAGRRRIARVATASRVWNTTVFPFSLEYLSPVARRLERALSVAVSTSSP